MPIVVFPPHLRKKLYRKCREAWPNEEYAILLGRTKGENFIIEDLYFPPDRLKTLNPDCVHASIDWFDEADAFCGPRQQILGDIHSHCYVHCPDSPAPGLDPSESDWEWAFGMRHATGGDYRLLGIVRVLSREGKIGASSRFWPAVDLPVSTKWPTSLTSNPRRNT